MIGDLESVLKGEIIYNLYYSSGVTLSLTMKIFLYPKLKDKNNKVYLVLTIMHMISLIL